MFSFLLNGRKFTGRHKLQKAEAFIENRKEKGQVWEIAENHGKATVVIRIRSKEA